MPFARHLDDPLHRQAYAYWRAKRAGRRMPRRSDIDPTEIRLLLPNIAIAEALERDGVVRFRYRLVGTAIVDVLGKDPTGHYADEVFEGADGEFLVKLQRMVFDERRPLFCESEYSVLCDASLRAKRLLLPLSDDDNRVNQIFSLLVFHHGARQPAVIALEGAEKHRRHPPPIVANA